MTTLTYRQTDSAASAPDLLGYCDLLTQMVDFAGAIMGDVNERNWRNAVFQTMRRLLLQRDWKYYTTSKTIRCSADVSLTASYDHTGGAFERLVTVTSGTLPAWINLAHCIIDGYFYEVEEWKSTTTFTLTGRCNPGDDVASGTMTLGQAIYPMPSDYLKMLTIQTDRGIFLDRVETSDLAYWESNIRGPGTPNIYGITGNPRYYASQFLKINPRSTGGDRILTMQYRRYSRSLKHTGFDTNDTAGTITTGGTNSVEYATTSGSTVATTMLGALVRLRTDTNIPEGLAGKYPYIEQRVIVKVDTGTNRLYPDRPFDREYTAKAYCVTDPVDIPPHIMNALIAACRVEFAKQQPKEAKEVMALENFFRAELTLALEAEASSPDSSWYGPIIIDRMHTQNE